MVHDHNHHQGAAHAHNKGHGGGSGHHTATAEAKRYCERTLFVGCPWTPTAGTGSHPGRDVLFLLRENCQTKFAGRSGQICWTIGTDPGSGSAGGHDLYLSDAPPDPSGRSRIMPDLRDGAGTRNADGRNRTQCGTGQRRLDGSGWVPPFLFRWSSLGWAANFFGLHRYIPGQINNWLQLILATPVVLWAGWPFFSAAGRPW